MKSLVCLSKKGDRNVEIEGFSQIRYVWYFKEGWDIDFSLAGSRTVV